MSMEARLMPALHEKVFPTAEGEVRLLLLIDAFGASGMNGRTQLAKTDFFVRYPRYLREALTRLGVPQDGTTAPELDIEQRMIRYRYGPWDPTYFTLLGRLRSRRLIQWVRDGGVGFRTTESGHDLANRFRTITEWQATDYRADLVAKHLRWSGERLRRFIYEAFPEVVGMKWGQEIPDAP
jgi:hypothetical protein